MDRTMARAMNRLRSTPLKNLVLVFSFAALLVLTPNLGQCLNEEESAVRLLEGIQSAFRVVAKKVLPVVVEINAADVISKPEPRAESPFDFFFSPGRDFGPQEEGRKSRVRESGLQGLGSGFIVRRSGESVYVLTNSHVVGTADEMSIRLRDGRRFKAALVGRDPRKDLALVVFETSDQVTVAVLGDSDLVQEGDIAFAVANPLGFEPAITMGIVSSVGREVDSSGGTARLTDFIRTDAAINEGNSGGPLVNIRGEVIGVNTWISYSPGGNTGVGFSIPINNASKAVDEFIAKGKIEYGWLGIHLGDLGPDTKAGLKLGDRDGAFVAGVFTGSPADSAGIRPGDFITGVNGKRVDDTTALLFLVGDLKPGSEAAFEVVRLGSPLTISVKVEARGDERELRARSRDLWPGMAVVEITGEIQKQLGIPRRMGGMLVGAVDGKSPAGAAGFRPGDIIREINGREVRDAQDFYTAINAGFERELRFRILRRGVELTIGLRK